jgi:hypothetical protein
MNCDEHTSGHVKTWPKRVHQLGIAPAGSLRSAKEYKIYLKVRERGLLIKLFFKE